ncbi:MAG: NUDIX domain-containing protein [Gammaproteobacteria bacterium]
MPFTYEYPHPAVTTDAILFTVRAARLEVLLIQRKHDPYAGQWAFPGGFLDYEEDLLACAQRELLEETGISGVKLTQFYAAGTPGRDPRERNISIIYIGLVRPDALRPRAGDDAADVAWFNAARPPQLAFDHRELLQRARQHLAEKFNNSAAAADFLPPRFTIEELQSVYVAVLGPQFKTLNARKQLLSLDWLATTGQTARSKSGPAVRLYRRASASRRK